jgi:hypothetical protein
VLKNKKNARMKNLFKILSFVAIIYFSFYSCTEEYELGVLPQSSQLDFSVTPDVDKPNIISYKNTSAIPGVAVWDLGNSATGKGETVSGSYALAGDYTVTLTLYTTGGSTSVSKVISIANNDPTLLNTPFYNALTGGSSNPNGKTWVFDQYVTGHFGIGPSTDAGPSWWSCPVDGKIESCLYDNEFTFKLEGFTLIWTNKGKIYTNEAGRVALAGLGYPDSSVPGAGDFDVVYAPKASYIYTLDEASNTMTLSNDAFWGHYAGVSTYKIVTLTDDELYLYCDSKTEDGNRWWYRFIPKEKNIKPAIELKAVALSENFENETSKVEFVKEDMGNFTSPYYGNPAPFGLNTSAKVFAYQKTNAFYSNISYTAPSYNFDLKKINKIRMKVFIPEYNDYTTEYSVAGDWITNKNLLPQLAVKLQDASLGDNSWSTQTEIVKAGLELGKWLELEFDFSSVSDRTDYSKIVIQFGAEGHSGPGIFFFDDFSFDE